MATLDMACNLLSPLIPEPTSFVYVNSRFVYVKVYLSSKAQCCM